MAKQGSRRRTDGEAEAVWSFIRGVRPKQERWRRVVRFWMGEGVAAGMGVRAERRARAAAFAV
jgi:hypothetical protein